MPGTWCYAGPTRWTFWGRAVSQMGQVEATSPARSRWEQSCNCWLDGRKNSAAARIGLGPIRKMVTDEDTNLGVEGDGETVPVRRAEAPTICDRFRSLNLTFGAGTWFGIGSLAPVIERRPHIHHQGRRRACRLPDDLEWLDLAGKVTLSLQSRGSLS